MATTPANVPERSIGKLPEGESLQKNIHDRRRQGTIGRSLFFASLIFGIAALLTLAYTIVDDSFGLVVEQFKRDPATLAEQPLDDLSKDELIAVLQANVSAGRFRQLGREQPFEERSQDNVLDLVYIEVAKLQVVRSYSLTDSLLNRSAIEAEVAERFPDGRLVWRSWITGDFLTSPMNSVAAFAGIRNAILGSLWMILITIVIAVPIGVGAAVYLEEYATDRPFRQAGPLWDNLNLWITSFNRLIETNINNLAGVPSIIYGMLGLAIFVRGLEYYTSGSFLGIIGNNGRTIISASLTMALLILPLIIINAREAIRAVPLSLRQASYGLGATKWQTVWHHVLPNALPGILTGTILGMSRAIGETAPLILVGASTFIVTDPNGPFSKFTALPIQIYNWTSQPDPQFRNIAAAAIIVLLILLLSLNATAVLLRNRFRRSY